MMTIKDVPMMTADETKIRLNSVLYRAEWSSGYGFKREGKARVEAHRVISIDPSHRHFRTRCLNGCESQHSFDKGCTRFFGKLSAAKREAARLAESDLKKCSKKLEEIKSTRLHILREIRWARETCPRAPKPIVVKK